MVKQTVYHQLHDEILFFSKDADATLTCEENQFKCMRRCIPLSWRCDGDYDCIDEDDKTDEANCRKYFLILGHFTRITRSSVFSLYASCFMVH